MFGRLRSAPAGFKLVQINSLHEGLEKFYLVE